MGDDRPNEDDLLEQVMADVAPMTEEAFQSGRDALVARIEAARHKTGGSPVLAGDPVTQQGTVMSTEHAHDLPPLHGGPPPQITVVGTVVDAPAPPEGAEAMTILITLPPGSPGAPPHRHSGPAYGYVVKGAMIFELEGEPERVVHAGEAFWEPGGDVIHYQDGNFHDDQESAFVVTMFCAPGQPMLTVVDPEELEARRALRAPRP